jgi:hypothetical protein
MYPDSVWVIKCLKYFCIFYLEKEKKNTLGKQLSSTRRQNVKVEKSE